MTDTADLVKELRDKALHYALGQRVVAEKLSEWRAADELTRLSKENATLQAELAEAKRERDEARGIMTSKVWNEIFEAQAKFLTGHGKHYYANHQIVREAHQRAKEQCPLAADVIMAQAFFQAVASEREEIAWKEVLDERARADKLEEELAKAKNVAAMLRDNNRELVAALDDANNSTVAAEARAAAMRDALSEVKRQRDWLASEKEQAMRLKEAAESSLAAAKERVKELEWALEPFAEKATAYERRHPRTRHPLRDAEQITHRLGDFRAARAALAQKE